MNRQVEESGPQVDGPRRRGADPGAPLHRLVGAVVAALALAVALAAAVGGVRTASGRFAGTTSNEGSLLQSAAIDLRVGEPGGGAGNVGGGASVSSLALDAANLLPGDVVQRCLIVGYAGALDAVDVRMSGRIDGGSGLERYLDATVELGAGTDPDCTDFAVTAERFDGTLSELAAVHDGFGTGLEVLSDAVDGASVTVRVRVELQADDRAQGRDTEFWFDLEVRP